MDGGIRLHGSRGAARTLARRFGPPRIDTYTKERRTNVAGSVSLVLHVRILPFGRWDVEIRSGDGAGSSGWAVAILNQRNPSLQLALDDLLGGDTQPSGGTHHLFEPASAPHVIGEWH